MLDGTAASGQGNYPGGSDLITCALYFIYFFKGEGGGKEKREA